MSANSKSAGSSSRRAAAAAAAAAEREAREAREARETEGAGPCRTEGRDPPPGQTTWRLEFGMDSFSEEERSRMPASSSSVMHWTPVHIRKDYSAPCGYPFVGPMVQHDDQSPKVLEDGLVIQWHSQQRTKRQGNPQVPAVGPQDLLYRYRRRPQNWSTDSSGCWFTRFETRRLIWLCSSLKPWTSKGNWSQLTLSEGAGYVRTFRQGCIAGSPRPKVGVEYVVRHGLPGDDPSAQGWHAQMQRYEKDGLSLEKLAAIDFTKCLLQTQAHFVKPTIHGAHQFAHVYARWRAWFAHEASMMRNGSALEMSNGAHRLRSECIANLLLYHQSGLLWHSGSAWFYGSFVSISFGSALQPDVSEHHFQWCIRLWKFWFSTAKAVLEHTSHCSVHGTDLQWDRQEATVPWAELGSDMTSLFGMTFGTVSHHVEVMWLWTFEASLGVMPPWPWEWLPSVGNGRVRIRLPFWCLWICRSLSTEILRGTVAVFSFWTAEFERSKFLAWGLESSTPWIRLRHQSRLVRQAVWRKHSF